MASRSTRGSRRRPRASGVALQPGRESRGSARRCPRRRVEAAGAAGRPSRARRNDRPECRRSGRRRRDTRDRPAAPPRSTSSTPAPKPPVTTLSSSVTSSVLPRAWSRISWRSSGLAKRALIRPTDQPSASSMSAAWRPRSTIGPKPTIRMSRPSRSTSPTPIGQDLRLADRHAEPGVARVVKRERVVLRERRPHERAQLLLVLGAGDDHARAAGAGSEG